MNKIAIIKGDGIGPEIMDATLNVLEAVEKKYNLSFEKQQVLAGGSSIDVCGECLPKQSIEQLLESEAVLLGALGGPQYDQQPSYNRPETALLKIRELLGLYANIRPAKLLPQLVDASPLKPSILDKGIDFVVVRELTGGVYFGEHTTQNNQDTRYAQDVMGYDEKEITRIAKVAFELAKTRQKKVCSVDKANVLDSSKLWRQVVVEVAKDYPDVTLEHMYVDNCAMQICKNPSQFDVILTENMFGDILSDEASMITGSIGIIPSSSMNQTKKGMYEPIHGSAPDIAGKDMANPIGMIASMAMMLEHSFDLKEVAEKINESISKVLDDNYRTQDMMSDEMKLVGCQEMGQLIAKEIMA